MRRLAALALLAIVGGCPRAGRTIPCSPWNPKMKEKSMLTTNNLTAAKQSASGPSDVLRFQLMFQPGGREEEL